MRTEATALLKARRVWKCETADVYRVALRRHGTCSAWLKDAGGRPKRGTKAADQLARLASEMIDAGYTLDEVDARLVALVRGIAQTVSSTAA